MDEGRLRYLFDLMGWDFDNASMFGLRRRTLEEFDDESASRQIHYSLTADCPARYEHYNPETGQIAEHCYGNPNLRERGKFWCQQCDQEREGIPEWEFKLQQKLLLRDTLLMCSIKHSALIPGENP